MSRAALARTVYSTQLIALPIPNKERNREICRLAHRQSASHGRTDQRCQRKPDPTCGRGGRGRSYLGGGVRRQDLVRRLCLQAWPRRRDSLERGHPSPGCGDRSRNTCGMDEELSGQL